MFIPGNNPSDALPEATACLKSIQEDLSSLHEWSKPPSAKRRRSQMFSQKPISRKNPESFVGQRVRSDP